MQPDTFLKRRKWPSIGMMSIAGRLTIATVAIVGIWLTLIPLVSGS